MPASLKRDLTSDEEMAIDFAGVDLTHVNPDNVEMVVRRAKKYVATMRKWKRFLTLFFYFWQVRDDFAGLMDSLKYFKEIRGDVEPLTLDMIAARKEREMMKEVKEMKAAVKEKQAEIKALSKAKAKAKSSSRSKKKDEIDESEI